MERVWSVPHRIDWERYPSVVFESDDWGACEAARCREDAEYIAALWRDRLAYDRQVHSTLETPADLDRLFDVLGQFRGADGQPAVFTAFVCVGNPDFDAIREGDFTEYHDIGIAQGVPDGWERGAIVSKWREGLERGVFAPEFHSNLHHTSPVRWLERLRAEGVEGDVARAAFDRGIYCQGAHLPEFHGMTVRDQSEWTGTGIARFIDALGYPPACAITSDAYPQTETVWALHGIRTVCLKNCRTNTDQIAVYGTKPWNNQDRTVPVGAHEPVTDVIYMIRNVFFECALNETQRTRDVLPVIRRRWAENEPALISTHRVHYAALDPEIPEQGRCELRTLLAALADIPGIRFLTTTEVSDLYRNGWSLRKIGDAHILRKWDADAAEIRLPLAASRATSLPDGREFRGRSDGMETVFDLPEGDYRVEECARRAE